MPMETALEPATLSAFRFVRKRDPPDAWLAGPGEPGCVSVILPTHNRADVLGDALRSVASQTYRPIQLVVVDDGSVDETAEVIDRWVAENRQDRGLTTSVVRQVRQGAPAARNQGLKLAVGEFIQFLDSDDMLLPPKIAWQVASLRENPAAEYVWSATRIAEERGFLDSYRQLAGSLPLSARPDVSFPPLTRVPTNAVSGLFRRGLCRQLGRWRESLARHQDWEYMSRLLSRSPRVCQLSAELYLVRLHDRGRISDLRKRDPRTLRTRLDAASAAERSWVRRDRDRPGMRALRRRIRSRYASVFGDAAITLSFPELRAAAEGWCRTWNILETK